MRPDRMDSINSLLNAALSAELDRLAAEQICKCDICMYVCMYVWLSNFRLCNAKRTVKRCRSIAAGLPRPMIRSAAACPRIWG